MLTSICSAILLVQYVLMKGTRRSGILDCMAAATARSIYAHEGYTTIWDFDCMAAALCGCRQLRSGVCDTVLRTGLAGMQHRKKSLQLAASITHWHLRELLRAHRAADSPIDVGK